MRLATPNLLASRGRAGQPGPRAENRERGETEPRWIAATECDLLPCLENFEKTRKTSSPLRLPTALRSGSGRASTTCPSARPTGGRETPRSSLCPTIIGAAASIGQLAG